METKDVLSWQDVIMNSMYAMKSTNDTINSLYDMINLEYSKVNGMKPLHFSSPEKLNGEWRNSGQRGKITFIGRDLGLNADNWSWVISDVNLKTEHILSVYKNPESNGVYLIRKKCYGIETQMKVSRDFFDNPENIKKELISMVESLPF